jgi:hypothetical protein
MIDALSNCWAAPCLALYRAQLVDPRWACEPGGDDRAGSRRGDVVGGVLEYERLVMGNSRRNINLDLAQDLHGYHAPDSPLSNYHDFFGAAPPVDAITHPAATASSQPNPAPRASMLQNNTNGRHVSLHSGNESFKRVVELTLAGRGMSEGHRASFRNAVGLGTLWGWQPAVTWSCCS